MNKAIIAVLALLLFVILLAGCSGEAQWHESKMGGSVEKNTAYIAKLKASGKEPGFNPRFPDDQEYLNGYRGGFDSGYNEGKKEGLEGDYYDFSLTDVDRGSASYNMGYFEGFQQGYFTGFSEGALTAEIGVDLSDVDEDKLAPDDYEVSTDYETGFKAGLSQGRVNGKADKKAGYSKDTEPYARDLIGNDEWDKGYKDGYKKGYNEAYDSN